MGIWRMLIRSSSTTSTARLLAGYLTLLRHFLVLFLFSRRNQKVSIMTATLTSQSVTIQYLHSHRRLVIHEFTQKKLTFDPQC